MQRARAALGRIQGRAIPQKEMAQRLGVDQRTYERMEARTTITRRDRLALAALLRGLAPWDDRAQG